MVSFQNGDRSLMSLRAVLFWILLVFLKSARILKLQGVLSITSQGSQNETGCRELQVDHTTLWIARRMSVLIS